MNRHLRIVRPTDNLDVIAKMYREGLGFEILASFTDHEGFDGVMLGNPGESYHLEFTHHRNHVVGRAPTQDNLLVFYLPDRGEWTIRCERMLGAGFESVQSYNPYWEKVGKTYEDPDGYRVVLQNAAWSP